MRRRSTVNRADTAWADRSEHSELDGWFELCHDPIRRQKIQASLTPLHVEADQSLFDEISDIALKISWRRYWKDKPTPHEAARDTLKTIAAIDALLARFDASHHNHIDPTTEWFMFPTSLLATEDAARAALTAMRAELQRRADILMAMDGNQNAAKLHRQYWTALTELWLAKVPDATACSEPMFPEQTPEWMDKMITVFIDDRFRKR